MDENTGEAVTFDNLLVLFTDTEKYPGGILTKVNFAWGGVAGISTADDASRYDG